MGILDGVAERIRDEAPDRPYQCEQCEERFEVCYHVCPECGSFSVDRHSILV